MKPTLLHDLDILEVSLVDKAANKRTFLITKNDNNNNDININKVVGGNLREIMKNLDPKALADLIQLIATMFGSMSNNEEGDSQNYAQRMGANPNKGGNGNMTKKNEQSTSIEDVLKGLDDNVKSALAPVLKQNEELAKQVQKFQDNERTQVFLQKAAGLDQVGKQEEIADILKCIDGYDAKLAERVEGVFKAIQGQLKENNVIFKEIGSNQGGSAGAGSESQIDKAAAAVMQANPLLTKEQAITKALELNPQLYAAYMKDFKGQ